MPVIGNKNVNIVHDSSLWLSSHYLHFLVLHNLKTIKCKLIVVSLKIQTIWYHFQKVPSLMFDHLDVWSACNNLVIVTFFTQLLHRIFQSFLKTTWRPGWPISTPCWLWIINFYRQLWGFFPLYSQNTFLSLLRCKMAHNTFYNISPGWRGGRAPGAAEVTDLWQRCSVRSEVWWRVPAIPATIRYCYLEPFSVYRPGSQVWPGESTDARRCLFTLSFFSVFTIHFTFVAARKQCYPVLGICVWEATLQAPIWGPEYTH